MSQLPAEFEYVVDPVAKQDEQEFDIPLGDGVNVSVRQCFREGLVVDFSLNQFVDPEYPGNPRRRNRDVARFDCCHSEVHRHQFYRSGREQNYYVIHSLKDEPDHKSAEEAVNECYDRCYGEMINNFEDYLERWEDNDV